MLVNANPKSRLGMMSETLVKLNPRSTARRWWSESSVQGWDAGESKSKVIEKNEYYETLMEIPRKFRDTSQVNLRSKRWKNPKSRWWLVNALMTWIMWNYFDCCDFAWCDKNLWLWFDTMRITCVYNDLVIIIFENVVIPKKVFPKSITH